MKKHFLKKTVLVALLTIGTTLGLAKAADMVAATGILANIESMVVQAKANLALAASSGDVAAISEASKRADAVDAASAEANQMFAALEGAADDNQAATAMAGLEAAKTKADDALNGTIPEPTPKSKKEVWKESTTNTGGSPGGGYDPPNVYDVPWQSAGMRSMSAGMFSSAYTSTGGSSASSKGFGDGDATPE
jgi:hypothetical protein